MYCTEGGCVQDIYQGQLGFVTLLNSGSQKSTVGQGGECIFWFMGFQATEVRMSQMHYLSVEQDSLEVLSTAVNSSRKQKHGAVF